MLGLEIIAGYLIASGFVGIIDVLFMHGDIGIWLSQQMPWN